MTGTDPLADPGDVASIWRPLTAAEEDQVADLIDKASAKLRQACPFDIDQRIALYATAPTALTALNPIVVADVVATIVKRFLVNREGFASISEGVGPYSRSGTFVNRYDKSGSDVRGAIQVTPSDIEQLRPAVPAPTAGSIRTNIPAPRVLYPQGYPTQQPIRPLPVVTPDFWPGSETE